MHTINPTTLIQELKDCISAGNPAMIWGGPGIGKSDITDNADKKRYLTISKNKLTGFHGKIICNLDTDLSRYTA